MKNLTMYQVKEQIHNQLLDDYCLEKKEINEFLNCITQEVIDAIAFYHVSAKSIIKSMISWGNHKVLNCIDIHDER